MEKFGADDVKKLWRPTDKETKFGAGQVTIIGGSKLFHGAPLLALRAASRIVSMVYFSAPVEEKAIAQKIKSELGSFIWIPFEEADQYVAKSDAVLIGPGMMRNHYEADGFACDDAGRLTGKITREILKKFPQKRIVLDGGSLQVIDVGDLTEKCVVTPNKKEFEMLFREVLPEEVNEAAGRIAALAKRYKIVIVHKGVTGIVSDGEKTVVIEGGNPGLVKGGVGDVIAGLTVGFLAKNEPVMAVAAALYLTKKAADRLAKKYATMYNADDLADEVSAVYGEEMG